MDHGTNHERNVMIVTGTVDQVTTFVKEMSLTELQNVVLRLSEQNEHVHAALHQVWKEREREARVRKSVAWEPADWLDAREHFEPIIQDELGQCASLFQDRYEYADRGYDDYDSEDGRWDYTAGLEQLERWFAEMLEMAADGEWVDASVGLLLTLQKLNKWAIENGDEDIDGEDLQEECESFWSKADELAAVIRNGPAPAANKSAFFQELMDWIAGICEEDDDWSIWREPLRSCLFSPAHYERLREHVVRLEPALLSNSPAEKPVDPKLLRWWVQASLDSGHEAEALQTEANLTAFDAETSACFVHYYERLDRTDEAVARLQSIVGHMQEIQRKSSEPMFVHRNYGYGQQANHYFEWLVAILVRTGRQREAEAWRVRWFEALPSLELFKLCLETLPPDERTSQAENWLTHVRLLGGYTDLLMDMHLHLDDPDGAWQVYLEKGNATSDWLSDSARRLFKVIKQHDPIRLVPLLRQFAENRISEKKRTSYQRATEWLTELKSVYHLLGQTEQWNRCLREVRESHRRLPALQDEIAKAKL